MTSLAGAAPNLRLANRLGLGAIALSGLVAAAGLLIPGLYRDREILIEATRADNLFQLAVAVPLSLAALGAARRGSINGQLIVFGTLMYLAYFFGLHAVAAVVGGLTIAQVTIVGLAIWALLLGLPALDASQAIPFGVIALLSGLVVAPTLARRPREDAIKTRAVRAA